MSDNLSGPLIHELHTKNSPQERKSYSLSKHDHVLMDSRFKGH